MAKSLWAVTLVAALGCATADEIAGLKPTDPIGGGGGEVALLSTPAVALHVMTEEFVCPKCGYHTKKAPDDDAKLDGFYERISAHGRECFLKTKGELDGLIKAWRQRQDNLNIRIDGWNGKVKSWKTRDGLYATAQTRWNQDARRHDDSQINLNKRVESFNVTYNQGKKLDPPTFNYATGLKSNLAAEQRQLDSDKDGLLMIKKGLDNNRASLERELAALKQEQANLAAEQKELEKERESLQTMLKSAEK